MLCQGEQEMIKRRTSGFAKRDIRDKKLFGTIPDDLPLVHVTAVGAAREIIDSGQIEMRHCRVFKRDLVYFFLLRPAYRVGESDAQSDQINRFPFVFVVDAKNMSVPSHVYPFDTGAASAGIYGDWPDPFVPLDDYELEPNLGSAAGLIGWAFGSVEAYFNAEVRQGLKESLKSWESAAQSYLTIAALGTTGASNRPDKRASAIEVAYDKHVPLKGNATLAILPKQLLESQGAQNSDLVSKLTAIGMVWEAYDWQPNTRPDDFFVQITEIAAAYFKTKGLW